MQKLRDELFDIVDRGVPTYCHKCDAPIFFEVEDVVEKIIQAIMEELKK